MTLLRQIVYVVTPLERTLVDEHARHAILDFVLLEDVLLMAKETPAEEVEFYTGRAKIAFLCKYWDHMSDDLVKKLLAVGRDPLAQFDAFWSIRRFDNQVAIEHALDHPSQGFLATPHTAEMPELTTILENLQPASDDAWLPKLPTKEME
jgi:hypothetical protein